MIFARLFSILFPRRTGTTLLIFTIIIKKAIHLSKEQFRTQWVIKKGKGGILPADPLLAVYVCRCTIAMLMVVLSWKSFERKDKNCTKRSFSSRFCYAPWKHNPGKTLCQHFCCLFFNLSVLAQRVSCEHVAERGYSVLLRRHIFWSASLLKQ